MHVEINSPRESIPNTTKEVQKEQWRNLEDSNYLKCLKGYYPNNKLCLLYYCSHGISISRIHSSCKMQKHILGSPPINRKMVELLFLQLEHNMPIINYGDLIWPNLF